MSVAGSDEKEAGAAAEGPEPEPMTREAAIERFGSHWRWQYSSDAAHEVLGPRDPQDIFSFATFEEVVAHGRASRAKKAAEEVERIERILNRPRARFLIWLAKLRLHYKSSLILSNAAEFRRRLGNYQAILAEIGSWEPDLKHLPETLVIPTPLELGRSVWNVDFTWPLSDGIKITEWIVDSFSLTSRIGVQPRGVWDYEIRYNCACDGQWRSFGYNRADESVPEISGIGYHGQRMFLTREAAEQCLREVADLMRARADDAIATL